ncbi:Ger(x)C family spore germination protein [Paenibacillus sp. ACRRY]|uniref:Ger(x)C family spore germination protein n=1 Tax=Paenibacillus sp. ACRRY TaxID=2918208 RepID=UPI001EF643B3|nr:Ger(x)C family spore germination protein [Paenibacillus sp. ACRRY]MCG7382654.1 Ger(x)C family spore germination protein [Paenibacillus sp. ACRRY]
MKVRNLYRKSGLMLISFLLCSGCWSKVEINERTFITAMYVDKGETPGDIEITLSMPLPNRLAPEGGGSSKNPYAIVSATAPTIADALEKIQTDLTRKISWGHTRVVVFGEAYAKEGIEDTLAWIAREPLFHLSSYIMVAKGKAKNVSDLTPVFEETPSDVLREFSTEENLLKTQVLNIFAAEKMNQGFASLLLTAQKSYMASEDGELKKWVSQSGAALFKQMKMVGTISDEEARTVSWAERNLDSMTISVRTKKEKASMTLYDMHSDVHVRLEQGEPIFDIKLIGKAELNSVIPILKAKDIVAVRDIEKAAGEKVSAQLTKAIRFGQSKGADILRLGYRLEWRYPKIWKTLRPKWISYIKNDLQFHVTTDINIQFVGSESSF